MPIDIARVYAQRAEDPDFAEVLRAGGMTDRSGDEALAEAIEADGRWRMRLGRSVPIERYLRAVENLTERRDALDAAIDVALRSLSGSSRITAEAVERLSQSHPSLNKAIREAATLNAAVWSTTGLRNRVAPMPAKTLPCEFGPFLADGRRRYRLHQLLGQGSFGQVYRAEDRQLSEDGHAAEVAIKVLATADRSEHDRHRMIDEASKARRISHTHVVQVLDRGVSDDDEDYIVYEFVAGGDLADAIEASLPLDPRRAAEIVSQVARGVHAAHAAGLIHCDLKPSNVMMTSDGQPKVADFGIAVRMEDARRDAVAADAYARGPIGNIAFISPEQYRGEDAAFSVPSDVYALGGMLYHLLTGRLPNGASREEIAATHAAAGGRAAAPSPAAIESAIDGDLDAICRRALNPDAAQRHSSAAALAEDLERWLRHEPITWLHPSLRRRAWLWSKRKPALAAAAVAMLVLAGAGIAVASHFARQADRMAMEAAVAQMKVDRDAEIRLMREQFAAKAVAALSNIGDRQRFLTDVLMQVWVYEYLYGPLALGMPEHVSELWASRVSALRAVVQQRREADQDETLETMLWETALAFWLISEREHTEALPMLDSCIARWRDRLGPDDPWLANLQTLRACGEVNRVRDPHHPAADDASRAANLLALESTLKLAAADLEQRQPRSPIHYLTLNRLADLYDASALNQPEKATQLRDEIAAHIRNTQPQATGVARDARKTAEDAQRRQP